MKTQNGTSRNGAANGHRTVHKVAPPDAVPLGRPFLAPAPRPGATLVGHRLAGFELRSVAATASRFYACALAMVTAATVVFWILGSLVGVVGAFEEFMRSIGFTGFRFLSLELLFGATFLAAVIGVVLIGMTLVAAALYNALANRHGGVRIFVADDVPASANGTARTHGNGRATHRTNGRASANGAKNHTYGLD